MEWYLHVLKNNYANFEGRARRKEYWMFFLINFLVSMGFTAVTSAIDMPALGMLYSLAVLVPGLAVSVRRMHDIGKSGWFLLLSLIPLVNFWVIYLMATAGDEGENEYGEDPKALEM